MYKENLQALIASVLKEMGITDLTPEVSYAEDSRYGDYASNIALVLAKKIGQPPHELAKKMQIGLEAKLSSEENDLLAKIEVAGAGFINFTLSTKALLASLESQQEIPGSNLKGKKVMLEYTDPNPFKEFHIGHSYTNIIGETLSRLFEYVGAEVKRACYQGDVGLHVAKAVWGMQQKLVLEHRDFSELEEWDLAKRIKWMGEAYALGATKYEEDEITKQEIKVLNTQIYTKKMDLNTSQLYHQGREWSLSYFEELYKRLGTKFDYYYFESEVGEHGLLLVKECLQKGVFVESNGAVIFPGEKYGLHSRVFINSLGLPTYEAKELALAPLKDKDYVSDISVIITGNEVNEYFKVLLKALEQISPDLAHKTKHLGHGMVRLPEGKMSSRTGKVISGVWLLDEAFEEAKLKTQENDREGIAESERAELAEKIGQAAIKWAFLKSSIGKNIEFSLKDSVSFEGNSGPYLQYTYARCQSVLRKAGEKTQEEKISSELELETEEKALLSHLLRFEETIYSAATHYNPSILTTYLYELAQKYNNFYQKQQIVGSEKEGLRVRLTEVVGQKIKLGLRLLGISSPQRM